MEGISDIKIIGMDNRRPARIRPEPYIDLVFKLNHKAVDNWCHDLNGLLAKHPTAPKIKEAEGLYIEAWVRKADEIPDLLEHLKVKVEECSRLYVERVEQAYRDQQAASGNMDSENPAQKHLDEVIANLNFD